LNFNYKSIKHYKLVDLFNNKTKINCFNRLTRTHSTNNNKFFSKQKVNISLINNKERL